MKVRCFEATIVFFLLMATTYAWAADQKFNSGIKLLNACEVYEKASATNFKELHDAFDVGYCMGIVAGISSTQIIYSEYLPKDFKEKVCWPDGTSNAQNIRVVMKYLRDHPAELHLPDSLLIIRAFREAYGCK